MHSEGNFNQVADRDPIASRRQSRSRGSSDGSVWSSSSGGRGWSGNSSGGARGWRSGGGEGGGDRGGARIGRPVCGREDPSLDQPRVGNKDSLSDRGLRRGCRVGNIRSSGGSRRGGRLDGAVFGAARSTGDSVGGSRGSGGSGGWGRHLSNRGRVRQNASGGDVCDGERRYPDAIRLQSAQARQALPCPNRL